ncbi:DUF2987 domain-containing protein [Thalassotalea crassostreae]|uniref:DUF2987 domain-containing protein n=1 Tax=Thalassotalea crassostreae TaxID=1763536 RepID=UPI0012FD32CA|nr:DUF2987 domain-containing protein [Thalassotalea crassostreae]
MQSKQPKQFKKLIQAKKLGFISALLSTAIFTSAPTFAVDLEYKGFYQRLSLIEENELDKITMGFYLVDSYHRTRCELETATMLGKEVTPKEIEIANDGQLLVPLSETLYDKFAFLRVKQKDERQNCTLQMQIQVKDKAKKEFSFKELAVVAIQMQELVDDFGSFLWFMMPDVSGVTIEVADKEDIVFIDKSLTKMMKCDDSGLKCQLAVDMELETDKPAIKFKTAPKVISPFIEK